MSADGSNAVGARLSLAAGRRFLAIPGPTTVPDEVLQAMHRPAIDIYAGELLDLTDGLLRDLNRVFRSQDASTYIFASNGHGPWEAALSNTLSRGDRVLVCASGLFGLAWGETASEMGLDVEILPGRPRGGVDPNALEDRLRADSGGAIKAVLAVQIDTASSAATDVSALRAAIDASGRDPLFMIDGVASIGCVPFEMDAWRVDVAMTGSQKGLMTPPGLGFLALAPRARSRRSHADLATRYWDVEFRDGPQHYQKYCGTPPEQLLFGLRTAFDMLLQDEGLEAAWARHAALADAARAAVEQWARGGALEPYVLDPSERSNTVTTVVCADGYPAHTLRRMTDAGFGVTIGAAIGDLAKPSGARIAHMGHVNGATLLGVLGAVEASMAALNWPGAEGGVQAATQSLASAVAID